jgi:hypothetical protein
MKKIFLFSFTKLFTIPSKGERLEKVLVVFCPYKNISKNPTDIYNELRSYFQFNMLPDRIVILCAVFNENEIIQLFETDAEIYNYIPLFTLDSKNQNISINSLHKNEGYKNVKGFNIDEDLLSEIINRGMVDIFNENGGLIVSESAHHFVFPSGKHSNKFLRPGNVLIKGLQISFIAFGVYKHLKGREFVSIYSDTSSINSLAYAYVSLLREFNENFKDSVQIESFGSYEGFESAKFSAPKNSLFIISSSTSGSIIDRMLSDRKQNIKSENICILYGLDVENKYKEQVICDLNYSDSMNANGLKSFESYNVNKGIPCKFCIAGSRPINIHGDVFLLEKPFVNLFLLSLGDSPSGLKSFSNYFKKGPQMETIIKTYYKENSSDGKKYEVFIDTLSILNEWKNRFVDHPWENIFGKLEKYIIQSIPASIKYLVVLPDKSSTLLAQVIISVLEKHGINFNSKNLIGIKDINPEHIDNSESGTIAVISSSISTGRNLLFISRALRDFEEKYQRVFFTFINRTGNQSHLNFLESNLSLGEFGKGTHKIINVETILCSQEAYATPWHIEKEFLKELEEFCEFNDISPETVSFCKRRVEELNNSGEAIGLSNNLFFKSLSGSELKINKGFAFAPQVDDFILNSTQADIYFIITTILNNCRCNGKLNQTDHIRTLLDPGNFVRFNDGIIQATFLRAAKKEELRYDLSHEICLQIKSILEDMINHIDNEHGEAIIEFFYAISIRKLQLEKEVLQQLISLLKTKNIFEKDSIMTGLIFYIEEKILI